MPIRPQHRWLYPLDWPQLSAVIRFERAKGRRKPCGRPHGQLVRHLGNGRWWNEVPQVWRNSAGRALRALPAPSPASMRALPTTRVFLATGHLDHIPGNNRPRNLKAFCQRCHMLHDADERRRRRRLTLRMRKAIGDLFACVRSKLIIELDGPPHEEPNQRRHDAQRDAWLRSQGWCVMRFSNDFVIWRRRSGFAGNQPDDSGCSGPGLTTTGMPGSGMAPRRPHPSSLRNATLSRKPCKREKGRARR